MLEQPLFDLVITGHDSPHNDEILIRAILNLMNDHSPQLEFKLAESLLFTNNMVAIRECLDLKQAEYLRQRLATLAVHSEVRPTLQIMAKTVEAALYTCPACGHQQTKNESGDGALDTCEACGVVGERYQQKTRFQQIMREERDRYERDQSKSILETLKAAQLSEEYRLREEARRKLGLIPHSHNKFKIAAGITAVLALGVSFGAVDYFKKSPSQQQAVADIALQADTLDHAELDKQGAAGPEGEQGLMLQANNASSEAVGALVKVTEDEALRSGIGSSLEHHKKQQSGTSNKSELAQPEDALSSSKKANNNKAALKELALSRLVQSALRSSRFINPHERVLYLLKQDQRDAVDSVIEVVTEPYLRSLLWLDVAQWEAEQQQTAAASQTVKAIEKILSETRDISQQVLLMGALNQGQLLLNEPTKANTYLKQALEKVRSLPKRSIQVDLLVKLAHEQALLGNANAARQVLQVVEPLLANKQDHLAPLISTYIVIADFAEAKKRLPDLVDGGQRQQLTALITEFEQKVGGGSLANSQ